MNIEFIKRCRWTHHGRKIVDYSAKDKKTIDSKIAQKIIDAGYAIEVKAEKTTQSEPQMDEKTTQSEPENKPKVTYKKKQNKEKQEDKRLDDVDITRENKSA